MSLSMPESKAAPAVQRFDGSIPEKYENGHGLTVMQPFAQQLATLALQRLSPSPSASPSLKILEVACGTGRLTRQLVRAFPGAAITASDISPDMLGLARTLITDESVTWSVADIQALPFQDASFDLVFCQFGYMFCPNKLLAFQESRRVLKETGAIMFLVWDRIEMHPLLYPVYQHVKEHYPKISTSFLETPCSMFNQDKTRELLTAAAFQNIDLSSVSIQTGYPDKRKALHSMVEGTPLSNSLKQDGIDLEAFEAGAEHIYDNYLQSDDSLAFKMHAVFGYASNV